MGNLLRDAELSQGRVVVSCCQPLLWNLIVFYIILRMPSFINYWLVTNVKGEVNINWIRRLQQQLKHLIWIWSDNQSFRYVKMLISEILLFTISKLSANFTLKFVNYVLNYIFTIYFLLAVTRYLIWVRCVLCPWALQVERSGH